MEHEHKAQSRHKGDSIMKVVFLDYGFSKSQTPDRVAARLGEILEANGMTLVRNPSSLPRGDSIVVRWGSPRSPDFDSGAKAVLNRATIISRNLDKRAAHCLMRDAGVNVPTFWTTWDEAKSEATKLGCDILRRRLHHTQGKDILRLSPSDDLPRKRRSGYYVQFLDKDAEFRLHMMGEKCIGLAQKIAKSDANPLIWNFENGWDIQYIPAGERDEVPNYKAMVAEAAKAMKALGFDFGAVDVILVKGKAYILEINTAPKLHDTARYAKPMAAWISRVLGKPLRIPARSE